MLDGQLPAAGYTVLQRCLHWITAVAVILLLAAAIAMNNVPPGAWMNGLYVLHWSLGVCVLPLALWRIALRLTRPSPGYPDNMAGSVSRQRPTTRCSTPFWSSTRCSAT